MRQYSDRNIFQHDRRSETRGSKGGNITPTVKKHRESQDPNRKGFNVSIYRI